MRIRKRVLAVAVSAMMIAAMSEALWAGTVEVKNADQLSISGYTQARFEFRDEDDDAVVNSSFLIRRSRVRLEAEINEYASADLEVDFASGDIVKDAYVSVAPQEQIEFRLGQYKKPFSQEELFSSSGTPTIDLGLTNGLTTRDLGYSGRDQGLMLSVKDKKDMLQGWLGVFSGAGEGNVSKGDNADGTQTQTLEQNRSKDFAARVAVRPTRKIQLAANASMRSVGGSYTVIDTSAAPDTNITHSSETFSAFGGDVKVEPTPGLILWGEVIAGDNFYAEGFVFDDVLTNYDAPTFMGFRVAGNYNYALANGTFLTAIQPEARFEIFDPNTDVDDDGSNLITAGLSLFFGKNVRWRNNVVIQSFQATGVDSVTKFVSELQGKI